MSGGSASSEAIKDSDAASSGLLAWAILSFRCYGAKAALSEIPVIQFHGSVSHYSLPAPCPPLTLTSTANSALLLYISGVSNVWMVTNRAQSFAGLTVAGVVEKYWLLQTVPRNLGTSESGHSFVHL